MYIQPSDNNVNMHGIKDSKFWKRIKQKAFDVFPTMTFNDDARNLQRWKDVGGFLTRPAENRFIMGATAILAQPTIDYYNKRVDMETREVSRLRTIAKIIAGTLVGIGVRGSCYKLVEKMTNRQSKSRFSRGLFPIVNLKNIISNEQLLKHYRNALSTAIALGVMCFTNFLIDAPLTQFLTNYFNEKRLENSQKKNSGRLDEKLI